MPREDSGHAGLDQLIAACCARVERCLPAAMALPVQSLGIVGAGAMGSEIALAALTHGLRVAVTDTREQALERLAARVGRAAADHRVGAEPHLRATADLRDVAACDLVLECVVEDLWVKERVLKQLEAEARPEAVLGTNTSTISIARLAAPLADPGRLCGIHFFLPVAERPLIEIVAGPHSTPRTLATATALARRLGKTPLLVKDSPGFLVNRLMYFYLSESLQIAAGGVAFEDIDRAAEEFGMTPGPLALMDQIGLDVVLDGAWVLASSLGDRFVASPPLVALVKAGKLGRKTGSGFHTYPSDGGARRPNPEAAERFARWGGPSDWPASLGLADRLLLPMLLEATRVIEEGKADDPRDIDLAVVLGFGFPASRGGLLGWADEVGAAAMLSRMDECAALGPRFRPTRLLREVAAAGGSLRAVAGPPPAPA